MAKFNTGQSFADGDTVTGAKLNNITSQLNIYTGVISEQTAMSATVSTADQLLIADTDNGDSGAANRITVQKLFSDSLTNGTFASVNLTGTITSNRTVATSATITTGTIPTLVSNNATIGTTTGTAGVFTSGTITTGLIPTLTAGTTTGTAGIFTAGTVATLNSTTGTITNLSTTLAGDFTISQGTGTLGTSGVTLGTYGGATSVPVLAIDAKGRVTTASTSAITSGFTGFRNRIINGDMRIDQRNDGAAATANTYCPDRWKVENSSDATFSAQQVSDAPTGFVKSLKWTTTLADASLSATQYALVRQGIEGHNTADFMWGTVSPATITISFWVKSTLTGTFGGTATNNAFNRSYPFTYTISVASTWEQKTVTIIGDTTGTWETTNSAGIQLYFGLGVGSTYSGTAGAWAASGLISATSAVSVIGTLNATWQITGVQLEAGSTATDFERRPIGTELALCQRYYWRIDGYNAISAIGSGSVYSSTTTCRIYSKYPVSMRSYPTLSMAGSLVSSGGNADNSVSAISASNAGLESTLIDFTTAAGTLGHGKVIYVSSSTSYGVNYVQAAIEL